MSAKKYRNEKELWADESSDARSRKSWGAFTEGLTDDIAVCNVCDGEDSCSGARFGGILVWSKSDIDMYGKVAHNLKEGDYICRECHSKLVDKFWESVP